MKPRSLLPLIFLITGAIHAQINIEFDKDNFPDDQIKQLKEAIDNIRQGDKLLDDSFPNYAEALEYYLKANDFNPDNALLNYKIGKCYLKSVQKSRSVLYLEKARQLNPKVSPDLLYLLGQGYHLDLQLDKAIEALRDYRSSLSPKDLEREMADIDKKISECETARIMIQQPIRVFIDNLGGEVNSQFPDYAPYITPDEMILMFTSSRDNTTGGKVDPLDGLYYEDIYISYKKEGEWQQPINPGKPLNSDSHDAIVGVSPDGRHALIYKGEEKGGDIFACRIDEDGLWSVPKRLPREINTDYHETSASFAPDMGALYFVTDKPGGYGGKDIYISYLGTKGSGDKLDYGDAVNLGPVINTAYDEEGVFAHPDGKTLYFSSRGHSTMGGYDLFRSAFENGQWSFPENLGYPASTPDDDVFYSISGNGRHGYYSTFDPNGLGDRDLFMVTFLGEEKPMQFFNNFDVLAIKERPEYDIILAPKVELNENQLAIITGKIMDAITLDPLGGVLVEIYDNALGRVVSSFESKTGTGKYMVSLPSGNNYGFIIVARDYPFHSENLTIPSSVVLQEIYMDILLKKVEVGSKIILKNIFFDFDKATLRPESTAELDRLTKLLDDMPTLKIEISGHTDNIGSALYNQKLSEERAKTVVDYLLSKGIEPSRLSYTGYGMEQPIATNDTEQGRQENRRTEFKVLSK